MKKQIKSIIKKLFDKPTKNKIKKAAKITVREAKIVAPKAKKEVEKIYHFGKDHAKKIIIEINKEPGKKKR
ncbi:MAG: hypothetical protein PHG05_01860 [Candidatus Nanoarchaeia archaeon]|nr:hypothetical protein [Candidatus Nanoarchaeia archaeon]